MRTRDELVRIHHTLRVRAYGVVVEKVAASLEVPQDKLAALVHPAVQKHQRTP